MAKKTLVIITTPRILQSGLSRSFFEEWYEDEDSGIIFTGYNVEEKLVNTKHRN